MKTVALNRFLLIIVFLSVLEPAWPAVEGYWPGWRGDGSAITLEKQVPYAWDRNRNILWKTVIPGEGSSSPIVSNGRVFVTSSSDSGKTRHIICLDAVKGSILWDTKIAVEKVGQTHPYSGYAAPTPVTDGKTVYAFFESPGLVAVDYAGNVLWTRPIGPINNIYNLASSPIIAGGLVIFTCDHSGESFIAAVDKTSGKTRWQTKRPPSLNYSTPILVKTDDKNLVVMNGNVIRAYDLQNGFEIWNCKGMTDAVTPSPVQMNGIVLCTSGRNGPTLLLDPKGEGDVSETCILSQIPTGGPYVVSPIAAYGLFLVPNDNGTVRVYDRTGFFLFEHRFPGQFSSSPVAIENRIHWTSERGDTYIFSIGNAAKPQFNLIRVNSIGARILASPAIAQKRMYIRSTGQLFCIAGNQAVPYKPKPAPPLPSFQELKELIESHPGIDEGNPNIAIRVELVDKMGQVKDPAAPEFLKKLIMDDHWDVSETAMRSLAKQGEPAVPVLVGLLNDYRQWVRTISCQALGTVGRVDTVPNLVKSTADADPNVRIAAMQAIMAIQRNNAQVTEQAMDVLTTLLKDPEAVVRASAVREVANAALPAQWRSGMTDRLKQMKDDKSPIVAANVKTALAKLQGGSGKQ